MSEEDIEIEGGGDELRLYDGTWEISLQSVTVVKQLIKEAQRFVDDNTED